LAKAAEIGGLLSFEECAFARNEDCSRRSDTELLRVIALVDGDADAVARIDEQKGIADGDIHKSFHVGQHHRFLVDLELYRIAEVVSQLLEFIAWNIRDQRTEGIIERDNVTGDALVADVFGVRRTSCGTSGPTRLNSHPAARCAPAGEKMSRPWKVEEIGA